MSQNNPRVPPWEPLARRPQREISRLRAILVGRPLATAAESHERLSKSRGLAVFATDNISSSAYASEQIMRILSVAGLGAIALTVPVSLSIVFVLVIVVISYHQIIKAYPKGASCYIVAKENLGLRAALVAAAALLTDYILTVAVSVAAGVEALTSLFPGLFPYRVMIGLVCIAILTMGNLRGLRESGTLFAAPTYLYLIGMMSLLGYGMFRFATGTLPEFTPPDDWVPVAPVALAPFLVMRAFASGAVALTGVEAVSDGVGAFKAPEARNARIVLTWMAILFAPLFLGISFLSSQMGLLPDPEERQTLLSLMTRMLVGSGWAHQYIQISTAVLLLIAANTAFAGFPLLGSFLARDKFLPHHFGFRGMRLAFSGGIVFLAVTAGVLIVLFRGSVTALIPLYTIGVFVAFTLSQSGMVKYWWKQGGRGWRRSMLMNGFGAAATGIVAIEVASTKFLHGAWFTIVAVLGFVLLMRAIRKHYDQVAEQLSIQQAPPSIPPSRVLVLLVGGVHQATMKALEVAQAMQSEHLRAVHVAIDPPEAEEVQRKWREHVPGIDLEILPSPYRELINPLVRYIDTLKGQYPRDRVVVVLPEFIPQKFWHHLLHRQTAMQIRWALEHREDIEILTVPYQLREPIKEKTPAGTR